MKRLWVISPYLVKQQWNKFVDWLIGDRLYEWNADWVVDYSDWDDDDLPF